MKDKTLSDEFIGVHLNQRTFYSNPLIRRHNICQVKNAYTVANIIGFCLFILYAFIHFFSSQIDSAIDVFWIIITIVLPLLSSVIIINIPKHYAILPQVLWLTTFCSFLTFVHYLAVPENINWLIFLSAYYLLAIIIVAPVMPFKVYLYNNMFFCLMMNISLLEAGILLRELLIFDAQILTLATCALHMTYRQQLNSYRTMHILLNLKKLSCMDSLTDVFNRGIWHQRLEDEFDRAQVDGQPFVMLLLDIDNFKMVNDKYGHQVGDKVIQQVAYICRQNIRVGDAVGRLGGEEFGILLPNTKLCEAKKIARRVIEQMQSHAFNFSKEPFYVTVSVGISELNDSTCGSENLFKHADDALYQAKNNGRNHFVVALQ